MVIATSAPLTASAALAATFAPNAVSASALSRLLFQTVTGNPAASSRRAMGAPISPVPSKAILVVLDTKSSRWREELTPGCAGRKPGRKTAVVLYQGHQARRPTTLSQTSQVMKPVMPRAMALAT